MVIVEGSWYRLMSSGLVGWLVGWLCAIERTRIGNDTHGSLRANLSNDDDSRRMETRKFMLVSSRAQPHLTIVNCVVASFVKHCEQSIQHLWQQQQKTSQAISVVSASLVLMLLSPQRRFPRCRRPELLSASHRGLLLKDYRGSLRDL